MNKSLCVRFGFDAETIAERVRLTGLDDPSNDDLAVVLQRDVVRPAIDEIVDRFYTTMGRSPEFNRIVTRQTNLESLRRTQRAYLLGIGRNFASPEYFEDRLRIGAAHQRVGVSLSDYLCAYRTLQGLLIESIPSAICANLDRYQAMIHFIIKITALDTSLAIETYYTDKVVDLEKSIDSMRGEGEELRRILRTDSLTSLCSRDHSIQVLKTALAASRVNRKPLSVLMADLDHFKSVNDRYGHLVGDKVLAAVASRIARDARGTDTIGRYGGEEFLVVLEHTGLADAVQVAERMRMEVGANPVSIANISIPVTLSIGVAECRIGEEASQLVARADRALYEAKADGRNRIRISDPAPHSSGRKIESFTG